MKESLQEMFESDGWNEFLLLLAHRVKSKRQVMFSDPDAAKEVIKELLSYKYLMTHVYKAADESLPDILKSLFE